MERSSHFRVEAKRVGGGGPAPKRDAAGVVSTESTAARETNMHTRLEPLDRQPLRKTLPPRVLGTRAPWQESHAGSLHLLLLVYGCGPAPTCFGKKLILHDFGGFLPTHGLGQIRGLTLPKKTAKGP